MKNEELKKEQLHISVRNLVEFIFREGDIDNRMSRAVSADAMLEGTRIHRKIQKSRGASYQAEVPLCTRIEEREYDLLIEGRADGIFTNEDGIIVIDEIKGTYRDIQYIEQPEFVHQAQAMCYAYIYLFENKLDQIGIQITYCNFENEEIIRFPYFFEKEQVKEWFDDLMEQYHKWIIYQLDWRKIRTETIKRTEFPFPYRNGQKNLITDVYRTILRRKVLFMEAPTGVGKTISTIFPAVKAMGEGLADRIFYLTAKTITANVALDTFRLLKEQGYRGKTVMITAKEKMCFCDEMECNPQACPYAKGHYDRVNQAVYEILKKEDMITRTVILEYAREFMVCPFEYALDISSWSDNIICDYNYAFDPNVRLKRFFQEKPKEDYIFLVDEAHNLVDRSRQMYSASICKEDILHMKKLLRPYHKGLVKILDRCNRQLLDYKRECNQYRIYDNLGNVFFTLMSIASKLDEFLQKPLTIPGKKEILDFYFSVRNFINIFELVDENYIIYSQITEDDKFMIRLFCVDPSKNLQDCIDKSRATVFFSATLLPIQYYKNMLSTKEDNYAIYAKSPFDESQSLILVAKDVSTRYTRRTKSEFIKIAQYISAAVHGKKGNYMVFFPSYQLLNQVREEYLKIDGESEILVQETHMNENDREAFLLKFEEDRENSLVAFCVMGGIFGEGIDLTEDKLIGAIVVGTGIPQISVESEILKNYYDEKSGNGFDYALKIPGMNKVLQSGGRVIRTVKDRGIILLLDERFLQREYEWMYPLEWSKREETTIEQVSSQIEKFWN